MKRRPPFRFKAPGTLLLILLMSASATLPVLGQYYTQPFGGAYGVPPQGYSPYGAPTITGPPPTADPSQYGYNPYGAPPSLGYPPQPAYGYTDPNAAAYPPPYDPAAAGAPPSPFAGGEVPSFGGAAYPPVGPDYSTPPPVDGTNMMAWSSPTTIAGLKYSYNSQAGDYFTLQSRNGGRWETFPITMHLAFPEEMTDKEKTAVKSAVSSWQKYVDITLVETPDQARIELTWVSELSDDEDLGETEFTATHIDSLGRNITDKAIIRMLDPEKYVDTNGDVLKSAVMHQLGHALGINSHSDNDRDVMSTPNFKKVKTQVVQHAMKALASKTIGQLINVPVFQESTPKRKSIGPPVEKISKRDLNTLFRLYN